MQACRQETTTSEHQIILLVKVDQGEVAYSPKQVKHGAILYNKAEVFSLPIINPNGQPMLPSDWLIHSGRILTCCHKILESDGCNFFFNFTSSQVSNAF